MPSDELRKMTKEELFFENETRKHQHEVSRCMIALAQAILARALGHDKSKFGEFEREGFVKYTPMLRKTEYGSEEYKKCLEELKPTLSHHYFQNSHHPEYYKGDDPVGMMNIVDLLEMFCDWHSAAQRHKEGSTEKSIEINQERFNLSDQLASILRNTIKYLGEGNA